MEFKDLVGTHILQGVEQVHNYKFKTAWGDIEDTNATIIRISNKNYVFIDDPSDGWRSYCRDILETDVIPKYSIPNVKVRIEMSDKSEFVGINIIDEITNLIVLEIGTSYSDDYYPCCVMSYTPENLCVNKPTTDKEKCKFPVGITIKPDGVNELDPCHYKTKQVFANVIVEISECDKCGNIDVSWYKTDDTIEIPVEEWKDILEQMNGKE